MPTHGDRLLADALLFSPPGAQAKWELEAIAAGVAPVVPRAIRAGVRASTDLEAALSDNPP